jgi:toxin-antitoxin system PIN domain toxin
VILVDANLFLYATIRDYEQHAAARAWLEDRLNAPARVGLPWPSLLAFLRIATNPRLFPRPLSIHQAWRRVQEWLAVPTVWIPTETDQHVEILGRLLTHGSASGNLVSDAHVAALAIEHGLTLCSTDHDFARFPSLRFENPIAP